MCNSGTSKRETSIRAKCTRAIHVEPSLTKYSDVWMCSMVRRTRQARPGRQQSQQIDIMPKIKEYMRHVIMAVHTKLRRMILLCIYDSVWNQWIRRINLWRVKLPIRIQVRRLLSLNAGYDKVFMDPKIKKCWDSWKHRTRTLQTQKFLRWHAQRVELYKQYQGSVRFYAQHVELYKQRQNMASS
jgi:hypothetical protein